LNEDPPEVSVGLGVGVGAELGVELSIVVVEEGVGVGVLSACDVVALIKRIRAAKAVPVFGISADPKGLTLSSIRRKSLCTLDR
jgi:hypothetical protein